MLSSRATTILKILVDEYIHTASPVASEDIARLSPTKVSAATVRNAMSLLTEEGYISRPHISAGGVPSDRGYRYYVESLAGVPELPLQVRRWIQQQFGQTEPDVEVWSQQCAATLSSMVSNLAIVTVPAARSPRLKHIQLVYLQEFLVMLIVVLQEARLMRRLLHLEEGISREEVEQTVNKLNLYLGGLNYAEIEARQPELTPLEQRVADETGVMLREAETHSSLEHYIDGLRLLLNQPEFSQSNSVKDLIEMIEEKVLLERILSEAPEAGDVGVYIGNENREKALRPFGVIVCQYGIPNQASGTICVIGPTRMSYSEAMSGVRYLSSFMSQLIMELYGGYSG